jgi:hypothetical protein
MPLDDSLCAVIPDLQHPIRTVADALDRLDSLPGLSRAERRRYRSALIRACRRLGQPAELLGFTKAALIGPIKALHPARCGLARKSLQNLVSDLQAVFRLLLGDRHHWFHGYPLTAEWAALIDRIPSPWDHMVPAAFARFAGYRGVRPTDVSDDFMAEYLAFLAAEQF